jgi:hypothetical protein
MTAPTSVRSDPGPAPAQPPSRLGLSLTQVIATALAAVTATVVASFFGVAGTVIGAGISSVLSVVGTAVYGHSLRRTRERMRVVVPVAGRRPARSVPSVYAGARVPRPTYPPHPYRDNPAEYGPVRYSRPRRRTLVTRLAVGSVAVFAVVLALVTGVEAVAQRPLSDLVTGNDAVSGTTLFGNQHRASSPAQPRASSAPAHPAPTITQTVTRTATSSPSSAPSAPSGSTAAPSPSASPSSPAASPSASDRSGVGAPLG